MPSYSAKRAPADPPNPSVICSSGKAQPRSSSCVSRGSPLHLLCEYPLCTTIRVAKEPTRPKLNAHFCSFPLQDRTACADTKYESG